MTVRDALGAATVALTLHLDVGATHTINGNQVNLYDGIGVQADTMAWNIEGEWQFANMQPFFTSTGCTRSRRSSSRWSRRFRRTCSSCC